MRAVIARLPGARDARWPCAQPAGRQHDPARLAVRRARAAGRPARARARSGCARRSRSPRWSSGSRWQVVTPVPADVREPRRPLDRALLLRAARRLARRARRRARPDRDPLHLQPLGDGLRLAATSRSRGAGCASSTSSATSSSTRRELTHARYRRWLHDNGIRWVARRTRGSTTRPRTRTAWCAQRAAVPAPARAARALARVRGGRRRRCSRVRRPAAQARRRSSRSRSRSTSRGPGRFVVRVRSTPVLATVERGSGLRGRGRRLDARAGRPARHRAGVDRFSALGCGRAALRASGSAERRRFSAHLRGL